MNINNIYTAHVNASIRNCNLSSLGFTISKLKDLQLQFLSLISGAYNEWNTFTKEQQNTLTNIAKVVIELDDIPSIVIIEINNNPMIAIPEGAELLYKRVYSMFIEFGLQEIKECKSSCKAYSQSSLQLFNMLQSASVLHELNPEATKQIDLIYKYVDTKLKQIEK